MKKLFLPKIMMLSVVFVLAACQVENLHAPAPSMSPRAESKMMMNQAADGFAQGGASFDKSQSARDDGQAQNRMLAYIHRFTFSLPAKNLKAVSAKALADCRAAGTNKCQIVTSSINTFSEDNVSASIKLRVQPDWFADYRAGLIADSDVAGGKVLNSTTSAEDLTIQISDSGARLKALKTLRVRLLTLLEKKGSTVKDLIEVERELARVQGQIESSTGRLRVLKTRVSMSEVYLDYQAKSVAASRSKFSAIGRALNDFLETVSGGIAGVIYFVAFVLPWLIFGIPILWLLSKWWRKRRLKKAERVKV